MFGELNGRGEWTFSQDGPFVDMTLDWTVQADKASLRLLSPLLKPLFRSNHRWDMRRGGISLRLELARRHALTAEERAAVPAPPRPLWPARRRGWGLARREETAAAR